MLSRDIIKNNKNIFDQMFKYYKMSLQTFVLFPAVVIKITHIPPFVRSKSILSPAMYVPAVQPYESCAVRHTVDKRYAHDARLRFVTDAVDDIIVVEK